VKSCHVVTYIGVLALALVAGTFGMLWLGKEVPSDAWTALATALGILGGIAKGGTATQVSGNSGDVEVKE